MTDIWAKVDRATGEVLNVELASDEWVAEHMAANPDAHYEYLPTADDARDRPSLWWTWDANRQRFIPPQPFPSWEYDDDTWRHEPPTPMPIDGEWLWDEDTLAWIDATADTE
jgi:hypothetical protein